MADAPPDDPDVPVETTDATIRELLGLFDAPAFARRGQDLDAALDRFHARCRARREELLAMVHLRLRQWAAVATGPEAWSAAFRAPIDRLWPLTGAEPPRWAEHPAPLRRQRAIARDLAASVIRFNRLWARFLGGLSLGSLNQAIDAYNEYYLLEKECVLGSARLAHRFFRPRPRLTPEDLSVLYPPLPVPQVGP